MVSDETIMSEKLCPLACYVLQVFLVDLLLQALSRGRARLRLTNHDALETRYPSVDIAHLAAQSLNVGRQPFDFLSGQKYRFDALQDAIKPGHLPPHDSSPVA